MGGEIGIGKKRKGGHNRTKSTSNHDFYLVSYVGFEGF
jgi:hypothetical protein